MYVHIINLTWSVVTNYNIYYYYYFYNYLPTIGDKIATNLVLFLVNLIVDTMLTNQVTTSGFIFYKSSENNLII